MAVLATHGHIDHVADAAAVADYFDIPLYIHQADRRFLTEPAQACNRVGRKFKLDEVLKGPFVEPRQVVEYQIEGSTGRGELDVAGMEFKLRHAPGHTPGCVLVILEGNRTRKTIVFCGDVVFAGSIGRTNFEVSDHQAMLASLRDQLLTLPDSSALLPGHGPATLLGHERATNPFLRPEFLDAK
jgi:glyoxylase-like metal-dependent hydrolase (beta-lactamase superfamily II)